MKATSILYYATPYGYYVAAYGHDSQPVKEYRAGNHPGDSQGYLTPKKRYDIGETRPVKRVTLRKWAREQAEEMAKELGVDPEYVAYDHDGEQSEIESYAEMKA
jgi:hypothetical protein